MVKQADSQGEGGGGFASHPVPLFFSCATALKFALFDTHVRDSSLLLSVLRSEEAVSASALFVRDYMAGAYNNYRLVRLGGGLPRTSPLEYRPIQVTTTGPTLLSLEEEEEE